MPYVLILKPGNWRQRLLGILVLIVGGALFIALTGVMMVLALVLTGLGLVVLLALQLRAWWRGDRTAAGPLPPGVVEGEFRVIDVRQREPREP